MTALALRSASVLVEPAEIFPAVDAGPLAALIAEHAETRHLIERAAEVAAGDWFARVLPYFIDGNVDRDSRSGARASSERLFQAEGAIKALNASSWQRALELTDVYQVMPQKRRDEWNESIREMKVPDFDAETVTATIGDLLASRQRFFAEKVDGVFRALSGDHATNSPRGFSRRMILNYIHSGGIVSYSRDGYISDLRAVVAKFMRREEPRWYSSQRIVGIGYRRSGEWIDVDGGALRIRVYLKGTAHLEVHPDMAWRLNEVLHSLYPRAIAAEHRAPSRRPPKNLRPIQRPLPGAVVEVIAGLERNDRGLGERWTLNWYKHDAATKTVRAEAVRVLESLGAVVTNDHAVAFDYDAREVLDEVVASGCIPDRASFQFYPTPPEIAAAAVALAEIGPADSCLEPSAGQGGIAGLLPAERAVCVELSALHCAVLRAKGLPEVIEADFLAWETGQRFDRVVMNPPYSEGRWGDHLRRAAELVAPGGRLVAILPASQRGKELLPGWRSEWSEAWERGFEGTGMAVAIVRAERCP